MTDAVVIGGGPAGLMAAEQISAAGYSVAIADAMPSIGRKFLMAGKSGLNITKAEAQGDFIRAFHPDAPALMAALNAFGPNEVMDWVEALQQPIFTGSTGRVFPTAMKASPLLRAWLARLARMGVVYKTRWRWTGWDDQKICFATPDGSKKLAPKVTVLALGGASWSRLGSDGAWAEFFRDQTSDFAPANMGFGVDWSPHMQPHFGKPVKSVALCAGPEISRGEWTISVRGIEGGGVYMVSRAVRDGAALFADLLPDWSADKVTSVLAKPRGKASLTNFLRKALRLDPVRLALLSEFGRPFPEDLAALVKRLPITHTGPRPLDEAISTAGGIRFDAVTSDLMLQDYPGVFCAGEMLDWEAPTGGYLITGCLATGRKAGLAAVEYLIKEVA